MTTGHSGAVVRRSPDGAAYAKTAATPAGDEELADERDRLEWLAGTDVGCPRVLDWLAGDVDGDEAGRPTLLTSTLPGVSVADLDPAAQVAGSRRVTRALVETLAALHGLVVDACPFDRSVSTTSREVAQRVAAGRVDESDFDAERLGRSASEVHADYLVLLPGAAAAETGDLVVAHGDFCLPNVGIDPETLRPTGVLDVGRLGVADRHQDLGLLRRSLADRDLNPAFGPVAATAALAEYAREVGARVDSARLDFYALQDEFF